MTIRLYVPGDWETLRESVMVSRATVEAGIGPQPFGFTGHVVTDELRAALPDLDDEELEHYVVTEAAQDSLRLFSDEGEPLRRLVLVFDVDAVERVAGSLTGAEARGLHVPEDVVAWLVDTEEAAADVDAAAAALATETGEEWSESTRQAVEACLDHDLAWYAATEADEVLALR